MLPTHLFFQTVRATSVRLNTPALGSLWVPCRLDISPGDNSSWEKILCAYLNSSIGILSIMGDRTNKKANLSELIVR